MEIYSKTVINEGDQPWRYNPNPSVRGVSLYSTGFSWPPRSYTCSFCKREFRSAQALGGHMNVHRRDRARLRQYSPPWDPPLLNPNPNPNPNPNRNPNSNHNRNCNSSTKISIPNLNFAPPSVTNESKFSSFGSGYGTTSLISTTPFFQATKMRDFMIEERNLLKESETVRLELEISSSTDLLEFEDGLDLELRLGLSY